MVNHNIGKKAFQTGLMRPHPVPAWAHPRIRGVRRGVSGVLSEPPGVQLAGL